MCIRDRNRVKLNSFLVIRRFAQLADKEELDFILKRSYVLFVKHTKYITYRNMELIIFMTNCYIELLSINIDTSYFMAFGFIRQLALHLKKGLEEKSKETIHNIYNATFLNSIKLWVKAIQRYPTETELGQLAYPLIEIITGALNLYPGVRYFPLRLQMISLLNHLAASTNQYIPTVSHLFSMFKAAEFNKKKLKSTAKPFDFEISLKVQRAHINTDIFFNDLVKRIVQAIIESLALHANKIYFPELVIYTHHELKSISKKLKFKPYKKALGDLWKEIRENSEIVKKYREKISFAPKESVKADALLSEFKTGQTIALTFDSIFTRRHQQRRVRSQGQGGRESAGERKGNATKNSR
eukprot:TRINITY_DN505_c0_g1_i19.p1 TRINITY_DN505_c0_g1~~TRINITY_DN505_c0_g1_i19.p1  ORF type:complete len:355 (+),score=87.28 TRINITY_DN505_c0_g1_i19:66-1130(+)